MQFETTYTELCEKQNLKPFKIHYEVNHQPPYQRYESISQSLSFFSRIHLYQVGNSQQRRLEIKNVQLKEAHVKIIGEVLRHTPEITHLK